MIFDKILGVSNASNNFVCAKQGSFLPFVTAMKPQQLPVKLGLIWEYVGIIIMKTELDIHMGVSENSDTPKSSILIGFSIMNHPFWGTSIFGNTYIEIPFCRNNNFS